MRLFMTVVLRGESQLTFPSGQSKKNDLIIERIKKIKPELNKILDDDNYKYLKEDIMS